MGKIRTLLATLGLTAFLLVPAPVYGLNVFDDLPCEGDAAQSPACQNEGGGQDPLTGPDGVIARVSRIVAIVAGIAAVIVMMYGGLQYITARGDASKAAAARNTITYAAIGLVIIALAQSIIAFVLTNFG